MEKIDMTQCCGECGEDLPPFTETSEHEIYVRKYVGGKGHLIELAFHKNCLRERFRLDDLLEGLVVSKGISKGVGE